ncbi:MAG: hypothetical protein ACHQ4H_16620, partial [Ktedonobacterales bacterium]
METPNRNSEVIEAVGAATTEAEAAPIAPPPAVPAPATRPTGWAAPLRLVVLALAALIGVTLVVALRDLVIQTLIATILAAGITPVATRLTRIGVPRGISVLLIYLVLILAV